LIAYLVVDPLKKRSKKLWKTAWWTMGIRLSLSKKGTEWLCTKLYKDILLLGLQYIPIVGQGTMDSRTTGTITKSFYVNFVDPISKAHTQRIESFWRPSRLKIVKNMCGTTPHLLHCSRSSLKPLFHRPTY